MLGELCNALVESIEAARPCQVRVAAEIFTTLRNELAAWDVHRIATSASGAVSVWFDNDGDGQMSWVELPVADALEFYDAGFQIYVRGVYSPTLTQWLRVLQERSGLGNHFGCALFATKNPHVSACHFDPVENITVQLSGSKMWRLARNRCVHRPTADLAEVGLYLQEPFPEALPEDAQEYALEPGQVLYIPRGYWHEVVGASDDPTLSLTLHYPALTWADLIVPALRTLLLHKPRWSMGARDLSQRREMIAEAAARLRALDPQFLFARQERPRQPTDIQRNPLTTVSIDPGTQATELSLVSTVHLGEYSRRYQVTVPSSWRGLVERLVNRETLSMEDVRQVSGPKSEALLDVLYDLDLVRAVR